jgi:hypothetical protein
MKFVLILLISLKAAIAGVYILENTSLPPWGGEKISADVIWGKNMKREREKGGKCKRKRQKEERKRNKGERK